MQAIDTQGNKVWERALNIYGRVRKEEGEKGFCCFLFQGQYLDTETELVYNYKRYYSQEIGASLQLVSIPKFTKRRYEQEVCNSG